MYMRIYRNQLIKVYTQEDLKSSDIIGKLKGKEPAGFTIRDKKSGKITFYDIDEISAKELQLLIRNSTTSTIAIKLQEEEIIDYFYGVIKIAFIENNRTVCSKDELYIWMNSTIDSGIVHSTVWEDIKLKVLDMLNSKGFRVTEL